MNLGHSKSGVYVCKYVDVTLKYNESGRNLRLPVDNNNTVVKMVMFKIMYGKQTMAVARKDVKLTPIQATPGYHSHMSVIAPKERDDIEVQFDHSQIFLYELDANKTGNKKPRHCLPYLVITWAKQPEGKHTIVIYI